MVNATMDECAYFVGPFGANEIGPAEVAGQPANGTLALGLIRAKSLVNTSSYAWLAFLARKPAADWLTAKG